MPIRDRAESTFSSEPISTLGAKLFLAVQQKLKAMLHRQPRFRLALRLLARLETFERMSFHGVRRFADDGLETAALVFLRPVDFFSTPSHHNRITDQVHDDSSAFRPGARAEMLQLARAAVAPLQQVNKRASSFAANLMPRGTPTLSERELPPLHTSPEMPLRLAPEAASRDEALMGKSLQSPGFDSGANPASKRLETLQQNRAQPKLLSPKTLQLFSHLLQVRLPAVYMHQSEKTDRFLQAHGAEAMTLGSHVYFRRDHADLNKPQSLGLLGHELTHVAQQEPTNAWRNAGARHSHESVENTALENERFVLRQAPFLNGESFTPTNNNTHSAPATAARPATTAMFASTLRPVNESPSGNNKSILSDIEMRRIKEEVYGDLMMRIKTDFERGA